MKNFKFKTLLLATSSLLLLTPLAHAADDDSDLDEELRRVLQLSEQTAREEEEVRRTLAISQETARIHPLFDDESRLKITSALSMTETHRKYPEQPKPSYGTAQRQSAFQAPQQSRSFGHPSAYAPSPFSSCESQSANANPQRQPAFQPYQSSPFGFGYAPGYAASPFSSYESQSINPNPQTRPASQAFQQPRLLGYAGYASTPFPPYNSQPARGLQPLYREAPQPKMGRAPVWGEEDARDKREKQEVAMRGLAYRILDTLRDTNNDQALEYKAVEVIGKTDDFTKLVEDIASSRGQSYAYASKEDLAYDKMKDIATDPNPLNIKINKASQEKTIKEFCQQASLNYDIAQLLLTHFWERFEAELCFKRFCDIYQGRQDHIKEILRTPGLPQDSRYLYLSDPQRQLLRQLMTGPQGRRLKELNNQLEEAAGEILEFLEKAPQDFLAHALRMNLTLLMTPVEEEPGTHQPPALKAETDFLARTPRINPTLLRTPVEEEPAAHQPPALKAGKEEEKEAKTSGSLLADRTRLMNEIAKYMLVTPGTIRGEINNLLYKIEDIIDPLALGWNKIAGLPQPETSLNLDRLKKEAFESLSTYCAGKGVNPASVRPLFDYLWDVKIKNDPSLQAFRTIYQNIFAKMKANDGRINAMLEPIFHNGNPSQDEADAFEKFMKQSGIQGDYEALKAQQNDVLGTLIRSLEEMQRNPASFIAQAPKADLPALKKGESSSGMGHEKAREETPTFRPALEESILLFQACLNGEFEDRQGNRGDETVMAFGNTVAKHYYQDIERHIDRLWHQIFPGMPVQQNLGNTDKIIELYNRIKDDLGHVGAESRYIAMTLEESRNRHFVSPERQYLTEGETQYDYLLMVSSQVLRFHELVGQENKERSNIVLNAFFEGLLDQRGACQVGMIGRLFMVHAMVLNQLIEYYSSPIKKG